MSRDGNVPLTRAASNMGRSAVRRANSQDFVAIDASDPTQSMLASLEARVTDMQAILYRLDKDSPQITENEEIIGEAALAAGMTLRQIEEAKHAFTMFDTDHVGFIDSEHLMKALASLGRPMGAEEVDQLVDQFDLNESGVIDVEEFLKLYTSIMGEDPACTLNDGDPISNYGTDSMPRWFDDDGPEINGDITGPLVAGPRRTLRKILLMRRTEAALYSVIFFAGVTSGVEANMTTTPVWMKVMEVVIIVLFAIEILMKLGAESRGNMHHFFHDKWNIFDFLMTAALIILTPLNLSEVAVLRVIRAVRLVRAARFLPKLMIVLDAIMGSMSSSFYVVLCLLMVMYIYAITGIAFFRQNDPFHFGSMGAAFMTLLRISTLEDWTDVMYYNVYGCEQWGNYKVISLRGQKCENHAFGVGGALYFASYVVFTSFMLLNLFIGIITTNMASANENLKAERKENAKMAIAMRLQASVARTRSGSGVAEVHTNLIFDGLDSEASEEVLVE